MAAAKGVDVTDRGRSAVPARRRLHDPQPLLILSGEFRLEIDGTPFTLPHSAERVLAYVALARRPVARSRIAGDLWPDAIRCAANRSNPASAADDGGSPKAWSKGVQ